MRLIKVKTILFIALVSALLFACKKEETAGTLTLNFVATANNQPFAVGNNYTTVDGVNCKFQAFKFYISNLCLYKDGVVDTVLDAALINFSADNPNKAVTLEIPEGNFTGFSFGLGLDSAQNKVDPTQYPSSSPFSSVNGMYWGMASMYRFLIIEGAIDTTADGVDNYVQPITIHAGKSNLYKAVSFTSFPLSIEGGETTNVNVNFDFNKIFYSAEDTINLKTNGITHTNDNYPLASQVMKNFSGSLNVSN